MEEWGRRWFGTGAALYPRSSPQQRGGHPDPRHAPAAPSLQRPVWPSAGRQCDWRYPTQAATQAGPEGIGAWQPESAIWKWEALMEMAKADLGWLTQHPWRWLLWNLTQHWDPFHTLYASKSFLWVEESYHWFMGWMLNPRRGKIKEKKSPIKCLLWLFASSCILHKPKERKLCAFIELEWQNLKFLTHLCWWKF